MWFDDFCHGEGPPDDGVFTPDEQAALVSFHQFYDARVSRLPQSQGTVGTWLRAPIWREIMQEAQAALEHVKV